MSSDAVIRVEHLSKCYQIYEQPRDRLKQFVLPRIQRAFGMTEKGYFREFWALRDVSFEVKKGETVGIIGRNGSGKSTLLQLICGTLSPSSGTIETKGRIAALLELGSGFNPEFTGRENVFMNAAILGLSRQETEAKFEQIAAFADIGDFIERPVKTYSSGMLVRLAFSVAINIDPEILIVDEALSVGDELFQRKCFARIEAIRELGATIIFVSHAAAQVVELCDRAILVDAGEKLLDGLPKYVVGRYQRLLYADDQRRQEIRRQIGNENELPAESAPLAYEEVTDQTTRQRLVQQDEYFDPDLRPDTSIEFDARGAEISSPALYTVKGDRVNGLVRGRRYTYSYVVDFHRSARNVRFALALRTISGLFLGGAFSAASSANSVASVEAGTKIKVEFSFSCFLNSGTYFLNAGVYCLEGGDEVVMSRIIDAVAFRVAPSDSDGSNGTVWFAIDANLSETC